MQFRTHLHYLCLTWERAFAWDLREMGLAWGNGAREGPSPQGGRKDKQSVLSESRGNMGKDEEDWASRT
jgi:hypothetical protein